MLFGGPVVPDDSQWPQAQAPPQAQPPAACGPGSDEDAVPATNENCRRTRSLPHDGHASAVLAASIFHFGEFTIAEAKERLAQAGVPIRQISRDA